jgi:hypothetical protein
MFEASVDGEAFDMERWGQYFKPAGMGGSGQATGSTSEANTPRTITPAAPKAAPAPSVDEDEDDVPTSAAAPAATGDAGSRAADIINMIRARQQKS